MNCIRQTLVSTFDKKVETNIRLLYLTLEHLNALPELGGLVQGESPALLSQMQKGNNKLKSILLCVQRNVDKSSLLLLAIGIRNFSSGVRFHSINKKSICIYILKCKNDIFICWFVKCVNNYIFLHKFTINVKFAHEHILQ